jgi:hypothetical protein
MPCALGHQQAAFHFINQVPSLIKCYTSWWLRSQCTVTGTNYCESVYY